MHKEVMDKVVSVDRNDCSKKCMEWKKMDGKNGWCEALRYIKTSL